MNKKDTSPYKISTLTSISNQTIADFENLISQLHEGKRYPLNEKILNETINNPATVIFIASDEIDHIVASTTLCMYSQIEGKVKAWIEDVVVDKDYRGYGLAKKLIQEAIDYAKKQGYQSVYLTSQPKRVAANNLYQNLGFTLKPTNRYIKKVF